MQKIVLSLEISTEALTEAQMELLRHRIRRDVTSFLFETADELAKEEGVDRELGEPLHRHLTIDGTITRESPAVRRVRRIRQ